MNLWPRIALVLAIVSTILIPTKAFSVGTNPTPVCTSGTCTVTFTSISDYYSWSAPRADTYTLEVWGAQGGNAGYNGTVITYGAAGGYSTGTKALTLNQTIYIYVGAQGAGASGVGTQDSMAGGYNGGGNGFNGDSSTHRGSGGGGASDIRVGGTALSNRIIVAGGGGGGVSTATYGTNYPGYGGGSSGGDGGTASYNSTYAYNGKGGTQSAGGAGGSNGTQNGNGSLGIGGNAVYSVGYGEGGGGGGYYGGGASGTGMGSGGGSGYIGGVSSSQTIAGNALMQNPAGGTMTGRLGNGLARITYPDLPLTSSFSAFSVSSGANPPMYRTASVLTAVVSVPSKVTFKVNNVVIPGCKGIQTTGGAPSATVTCSWKPSTRGSAIVSVIATPNNVGTSGSSTNFTVSISSRTGKR